MGHDDVIELTADEVRNLDVAEVRARGPAAIMSLVDCGESEADATDAVTSNLESFIEHVKAHPTLGAVRFHVGSTTLEVWR